MQCTHTHTHIYISISIKNFDIPSYITQLLYNTNSPKKIIITLIKYFMDNTNFEILILYEFQVIVMFEIF